MQPRQAAEAQQVTPGEAAVRRAGFGDETQHELLREDTTSLAGGSGDGQGLAVASRLCVWYCEQG